MTDVLNTSVSVLNISRFVKDIQPDTYYYDKRLSIRRYHHPECCKWQKITLSFYSEQGVAYIEDFLFFWFFLGGKSCDVCILGMMNQQQVHLQQQRLLLHQQQQQQRQMQMQRPQLEVTTIHPVFVLSRIAMVCCFLLGWLFVIVSVFFFFLNGIFRESQI